MSSQPITLGYIAAMPRSVDEVIHRVRASIAKPGSTGSIKRDPPLRSVSSIDREHSAGDIARFVSDKKLDGIGDVIDRREPA